MKKIYGIRAISNKGTRVSLVEDAYTFGDCEQKVLERDGIILVTDIVLLGYYRGGVFFKIDSSSK